MSFVSKFHFFSRSFASVFYDDDGDKNSRQSKFVCECILRSAEAPNRSMIDSHLPWVERRLKCNFLCRIRFARRWKLCVRQSFVCVLARVFVFERCQQSPAHYRFLRTSSNFVEFSLECRPHRADIYFYTDYWRWSPHFHSFNFNSV